MKKEIKSLSELPRNGRVETDITNLGLDEKYKSSIVIYYFIQNSKNKAYILHTKEMDSNNLIFHLRKEIKRKINKNEKDERVEIVTAIVNQKLVAALYERQNINHEEGKDGNEEKPVRTEHETFFYKMIGDAVEDSVSDIHIEKRHKSAIIRMRKHGELLDYLEIASNYATSLCSAIYNTVAEEQDIIFSETGYQSASVNIVLDNGIEVKLRYQSVQIYPRGFDVIMRVLPLGREDEEEEFVPLEELGYSEQQVQSLHSITSRPEGALVIAGTTGSGKSTTLKNLLMFINPARGYKHKIYTIEDPPEYKIPKVSQVPVVRNKTNEDNDKKKSPFEAPLTAAMRADPDILVIGEVRDLFTADGLKKAAQSGHQVMTTIHTPSALGIVERLADYDISYNVLGSPNFLIGLCYQKLVLKLCSNCSLSFSEYLASSHSDPDLLLSQRINTVLNSFEKTKGKTVDSYPIKIKKEGGCEKCQGLGITGRTVCAEIIVPNFEMLDRFKDKDNVGAYKAWKSLSDDDFESDDMEGKTVKEHAFHKMLNGEISPYSLETTLGPIDTIIENYKDNKEKKNNDSVSSLEEDLDEDFQFQPD